jgi:peroxiredoxin Q/BCP
MMFIGKHDLKVRLLSDTGKKVLESYGVWKEKSMYGKSFMGVERSTFLIDPDLKIRKVWRKVKVEGHAQEVLDTLRSLIGS